MCAACYSKSDSSDNQCFPPPDGHGKPQVAPHFRVNNPLSSSVLNVQPIPVWEELELYGISIEHQKPINAVDRLAYLAVRLFKFGGNLATGYYRGKPTEKKWLRRILFIESFSAVPGWVAAMTSHMKSFYEIQRDHGWLHTFLEESQNERMHLMTAFEMRQPGWGLRLGILAAQGVYVSLYFVSYLISPRYCHRFVGYMQEENVKAYTELIKELDEGTLPRWSKKVAPDLAIRYWNLPAEARIRDVVLCMRADEDHHRQVNHRYSDLYSTLVKNIQLHTLDKPVK